MKYLCTECEEGETNTIDGICDECAKYWQAEFDKANPGFHELPFTERREKMHKITAPYSAEVLKGTKYE